MNESFEVGGQTYRVGRMDAKKKFHVARRLAPLLPAMSALHSGGDMMKSLAPVAESLSRMSEEDTDYVIDACLSVCQRLQPAGGWAPITAAGGRLMFQDIDMPEMIQLTVQAIRDNIGNFLPGAAPQSPATT